MDKQRNRITVYNFQNDDVKEFSFSDMVKAGIFEDFEMDFSNVI